MKQNATDIRGHSYESETQGAVLQFAAEETLRMLPASVFVQRKFEAEGAMLSRRRMGSLREVLP